MKKLLFFAVLIFYLSSVPVDAIIESEVFPELVFSSALKENNIEVVEKLLESGQSSNNLDSDKLTPLAYAVKNSSLDMVDLLIKYRAEINLAFLDKTTPLLYASLLEKKDMIEILIDKGARIDDQDNLGRTSLMIAVERENLELVKEILKFGPDKELTDYSGQSIFDYLKFVRNRELKKLFE